MSSAHCGEAHALDSEFQDSLLFRGGFSTLLLGTRYPILWGTPGGSLFLIPSPFLPSFMSIIQRPADFCTRLGQKSDSRAR